MQTTSTISTPLARSKSAALARVLDLIPKNYHSYTRGECPARKLEMLIRKFHEHYGIGCTPAQRITRRKRGQANALLVLYQPAKSASGETSGGERVNWLLLVTPGDGQVREMEELRSVMESPRLVWLGYELVRHPVRGQTSWTWRRPKEAMAELYALLTEQMRRHQVRAVTETLERVARQPGFAGVREQSWALCGFTRSLGYAEELPPLFYLQKISHGERFVVHAKKPD
jgi:hypothetical protein